MGILIQGGRIVDAATSTDKKGDIYLEDGVITERGYRDRFTGCCKRRSDNCGCHAEHHTSDRQSGPC